MRLTGSICSSACLALIVLIGAPTYGYAGFTASPVVSIEVVVTPDGSKYDWDYRVALTNAMDAAPIDEIEIPEVAPGILSALSLPAGWSATELTVPIFGDPVLKDGGATAAWLYLSSPANTDAIGYDGSAAYVDFNLVSNYGGATQTDISTAWSGYGNDKGPFDEVTTVDPLTPNVPEPATWVLMGLGALGLVVLRRRKGALAPARA